MIDLHHVPASQTEIDARLENWGRYVTPSRQSWMMMPMWRGARTPKQWEEDAHIPVPIDTLDGHAIEKAVSALPDKHRTVIRWAYVYAYVPENKIRRECGLTRDALANMLIDARTMLINRV